MLFGVLALLLIAPAMPPFQNADEPAHAYRADQISHGYLLGAAQADGMSGGLVDAGLPSAARRFDNIPSHPDVKVKREQYAPVAWGQPVATDFPNTAVYPPFFYGPAAVALAAARALGLSVLHGVTMARMAGGVFSIGVGSAAIWLAGEAGIWLFVVLTLPMSLCLTAALSQDGPMLATTALAAALCRRAWVVPPTPRLLGVLAMLLSLVAMARPPYAAFAALFAVMPASRRARALAAAAVAAATLLWSALSLHLLRVPVFEGVVIDPQAQMHGLLVAPWRLARVFANTAHLYGKDLLISFIGRPGWLDVPLPYAAYIAALAVLAVAFVFTLAASRVLTAASVAVVVAVVGSTAFMGLLQYLTWSPVGAGAVLGLQGRYFLAPALLLAALPPGVAPRWGGLVLGFPVVSIAVTVHAIFTRYF